MERKPSTKDGFLILKRLKINKLLTSQETFSNGIRRNNIKRRIY
jgi:hypothetical protein